MQVSLIRPDELLKSDLTLWSELQRETCQDTAFFCPQFTQAVGAATDNVEVAVLRQGGRKIGFFPFQRGRGSAGWPVGRRLSDFHGPIVRPDVTWNPEQLIAECRLSTWHFNHLAPHPAFTPYGWEKSDSPYIDLSQGYDAWMQARREAGSSLIPQIHRKTRKLEREVGPLQFEWHNSRRDLFELLCKWKSAQRVRTKSSDPLRDAWALDVLDRVRCLEADGFAGVQSVLFAGDQVVAIHLGMKSHTALHLWFVTYNVDYAQYSPGLILLLKLAQTCEQQGLSRFDLGKGDERYKSSLASGAAPLLEGWIGVGALSRFIQHSRYGLRRFARSGALRGPFTTAKRLIRRLQHMTTVRDVLPTSFSARR